MGKGENAGNFPTVFSILLKTEIIILAMFILSSANALSLVQSKSCCLVMSQPVQGQEV